MKNTPLFSGSVSNATRRLFSSDYLGEANLLNLLPTAVCVCNGEGIIVNYNTRAAELWGRTPGAEDSLQFSGAYKLYSSDGEFVPHSNSPAAACLADGCPRNNLEIQIEREDSTRILVNMNVVPIKDELGEVIGVISCFNDITEERTTQQKLEWKTRELQDYVENASIGLHWVDSNGIIKWANEAELNMLGYSKEEYIGHHITEFHLEEEKIKDILKRLSRNETLLGYEAVLRCKDGSAKTVNISSNVFWDQGEFIHTRCFTVDVTQQKKLIEAVKESDEKFRQLINSLQTAIYTTDADGIITYFNETAAQLWGRTPEIGKERWCGSLKAYDHNGQPIEFEDAPMARCLREEKISSQEIIIERPDGTKRIVIPLPTGIYSDQGKLVGAINVLIDLTDQKHIEKALRDSELRYRQLVDSLDAAIYTTDLDGRITLYNKAAATLWGREPELGKDLWCGSYKIFRSDGSEMQLDQCPMAVCLKENRPVYGDEILVARPDGSQRKVAPHPRPLYDASGKMVGAINLLVDITELKATEEALRESEAKYRQLAERLEKLVDEKTKDLKIKNQELASSEDRYHKMVDEVEDYAIILLDKHGIIQNWNRGAEKIKGYTEKEIVGRSFNTFYFSQDLSSGLPERLLTLAKKSGKAIHEGWRKRKNGSRFWGSTVLTALHDAEGNVMGFTKVTRDLTERKLAEERLKEYTEELEFKNKELEQFAYAASHDLKEPLRKIHLYNESIADNVNNTLDLKSREYLSRSMSAVHRMNKLIEVLLEYSTMTANVKMIQAVDLNDVFKEIIFSHKDELDNKEIFIDKNKLPVVQAVPFQMKQLFSNLVNNSIKYKRPGIALKIQIESVVATANEVNKLLPGPRGPYHKISVIDNGIGFEQHYSEKIFEIFQRLDNGIDTKGSGIGLALCKRIIQNHHGAIDAIGEANKGARFDVYLPDNP